MRRSASEIINDLEMRIARLEGKTARYDREVFLEYAGRFVKDLTEQVEDALSETEGSVQIVIDFDPVVGEVRAPSWSLKDRFRPRYTREYSTQSTTMGITTHGGFSEAVFKDMVKEEIMRAIPSRDRSRVFL